MMEQEGLPGDVASQMIDLKMSAAPLPSILLPTTIRRTQWRNEPESESQSGKTYWLSICRPLCESSFGECCIWIVRLIWGSEGKWTIVYLAHCMNWSICPCWPVQYEFIYIFSWMTLSVNAHVREKTALHMKVPRTVAQCIRTHWLDLVMTFIHFLRNMSEDVKLQEKKKPFKMIKIRYDSNANNCLKNQWPT